MSFESWLAESEQRVWYHGSPINLTGTNRPSYDFLGSGRGYDQEGPGFYFTSDESDARNYGKHILRAHLTLNRLVRLKGRILDGQIRKMLDNAPDLADTLTNWDENPRVAYRNAMEAIKRYDSPHQAFQTIWYDFYRGHEAQYLTNMVKLLGFDGVVIPRGEGIEHAVVFDPSKIQIIPP